MSSSNEVTRWRDIGLQAIVLVLLLIPVFPGVFFRGDMIAPGDILFQSLPWSHYAPPGYTGPQNPLMPDVLTAFHPYYVLTKEAINHGEWPLWNMYELAGMPLLANCQTAVFYPPRLLHMFLDVNVATTLYILLKLWLCGMTAFGCARAIRLSLPVARFFSVAWMLASYNIIWCNWSLPDVAVWLPVLFAATEYTLEGRYRRGFLLMSVGGVLILLAGHPETAFAMCVGLGVYLLARLLLDRRWGRDLWAPMAVCAAAWALTLLVCAGQLLPFLEYLAHSSTPVDRTQKSVQTWLSLGALAAFWVPRFFGTFAEHNYWGDINSNLDSMVYPGMAVWIGVFALLVKKGRASLHRPRIVALLIAALFGALLSFNVYPLNYVYALPMFRSMIHCYNIGFCVFALPLLGAIGVEHWFSQPRRMRNLAVLCAALLIVAALVGYIYFFNEGLVRAHKYQHYVQEQLWVAVVMAVIGLAIFAFRGVLARPRVLIIALTGLLAVELIYANRGLNPTIARGYLYPETALTRYLERLGRPCRIGLGEGGIASGIMAAYGIEGWLGYDGLYPKRIIRFQKALGRDWWKVMEPACSLAYLLNDPRYKPNAPLTDTSRYERVATLDGLEVYKDKKAFPRAYLVGALRYIPNVETLLNTMKDTRFDPASAVLTEKPPSGPLPSATLGRLGEARIIKYASTDVTVHVDTVRACYLVLTDAYYPGWRATIDGAPAQIFPANYVFRGVVVPKGAHTVEFTYRPASFEVGMVLSTITLILGFLAGLYYLLTHRRGRGVAPTTPSGPVPAGPHG